MCATAHGRANAAIWVWDKLPHCQGQRAAAVGACGQGGKAGFMSWRRRLVRLHSWSTLSSEPQPLGLALPKHPPTDDGPPIRPRATARLPCTHLFAAATLRDTEGREVASSCAATALDTFFLYAARRSASFCSRASLAALHSTEEGESMQVRVSVHA